jgi:hypothetical protein
VKVVVAPPLAARVPGSMKRAELSWAVEAEVALKLLRRRFSQTG